MAQNTVCENDSNENTPAGVVSHVNTDVMHADVKMDLPDQCMECDDQESRKAEKRPHSPHNDVSPRKKKKKKSMGMRMPPKNAVVALNEMRPGLVYTTVNRTGPVHQPIFTISVEVDGQKFEGQGRSKKLAKHAAAEAVLRSFVQFKDASEAQQMMNMPMFNMDFTSDLTDRERAMFNVGQQPETLNSDCLTRNANNVKQVEPGNPALMNMGKARAPVLSSDKSPVMLLNELEPGIKFECVSENGEPYAKFTMSVTVRGETFQGRGPSKKLGKAAAAKSALTKLYNMNFTPFSTPFTSPFTSPLTPIRSLTSPDLVVLPQILADQIARLVTDRFAELIANDPTHSRRKVLAGIVMTTGPQMDTSIVISVATGTKCINGEHMSETGMCLNDTHAEIIARRCLCDFLYSQLELLTIPEKSAESIFVAREDNKGYRVKEHVKFHLYINTAPCGDARIFSPHEALDESVDKHPNRKARGQLRTKIESGEGTIPVKSSEGIQTWDGVMQGQRLLTMSCSDKIARWNVVGLQGSLLSHYVDPIYLDSIVLGSLFHPSHLYRAVCGRIETTVQGLPPPYRLNKPLLSVVTSPEVRQPGKAPNYSVNWTVGQEGPEIINSVTGKDEQAVASRLCKSRFFHRFARLLGHMRTRTNVTVRNCPHQYSATKKLVQDYNMAKDQLLEAFKKADLGVWLKKPIEQDEFQLSDLDLL